MALSSMAQPAPHQGGGCGKTALIKYLLQEFSEHFIVRLKDLHPRTDRLIPRVLHVFDIDADGVSDAKCQPPLSEYVTAEYREGRLVLLVVDEVQNLSPGAG